MDDNEERNPPVVTGSPERIWLVYGDIDRDCTHQECSGDESICWCEDAQFQSDVEYVRADVMRTAVAAEREACAKVCEATQRLRSMDGFPREAAASRALAKAIRARGTEGEQPARLVEGTALSHFVRDAPADEKAEVYARVIEKAIAEQRQEGEQK